VRAGGQGHLHGCGCVGGEVVTIARGFQMALWTVILASIFCWLAAFVYQAWVGLPLTFSMDGLPDSFVASSSIASLLLAGAIIWLATSRRAFRQ
jgi:hypothetical protein